MSYKLLFMGTPPIAAVVLKGLLDAGYDVIGVVCQPDRKVGRKQLITPPPTKELALAYNLPVYQPEKLRLEVEPFLALEFDALVTCAYGQMVPEKLLQHARVGAVNVHGSILPKYRGGAPIQWAIRNGDTQTGITIQEMVKAMDAGKMYAKAICTITPSDTTSTMFEKLAVLGRDLLLSVLPDYLKGTLQGTPQDETQVTFAYTIKRDQERLDWKQSAVSLHNQVRSLLDEPGAYAFVKDAEFKIWKTTVLDDETIGTSGTILSTRPQGLDVQTGRGILRIEELQLEGKKRLPVRDILNGKHPFQAGTVLE